ncbi:MAG: hypothetical protein S4CHLAM45_03490 [Chlamydiales bacterium]|nr:hypothetical protein [Chlamydiales bacterium]MCH9619204.1 hypothetical protein [Chlamydiales bacterium]MCH9622466.1 hypothetical protein [Chlamydiales bacterium]
MFEVLFGSKNVEKILIFLFVNGRCYGAQLQRVFNTPLTPLQKVLIRLEQGGLICSHYEGKTRIYRFNQGFPLLSDLEQLLKKAYTLLPAHEKKLYYLGNDTRGFRQNHSVKKLGTLLEFWERLTSVKRLSFQAYSKSKENSGWNGRGTGEVDVSKTDTNILVFHEKGSWKGKDNRDISFTNIFRWTLDRVSGVISLEHLRRGIENPVFLFHLAPSTGHTLSSVDSHLCDGDSYFGQVQFDQYSLKLTWRVIGPKKNEEMEYSYL